MRGEVLGAVGQPQLVAVDQVCTLRRSVNGGMTVTSTLSKYLSGSANAIFWTSAMPSKVVEVHLPVARDQRFTDTVMVWSRL